MKREDFTIFWSVPPDALDWSNVLTSGVRRVMLPWAFATPTLLAKLRLHGIRAIIRLDESDYYGDNAPTAIRLGLEERVRAGDVEAVVIGVEPENGINMRYGSPSWRHDLAQRHAAATNRVARAISGLGLKVITAGWTMRGVDPQHDPPEPGVTSWREHTAYAYTDVTIAGNGFHLYEYDWIWQADGRNVDFERAQITLRTAQEHFHKPLWIDELGIDHGTPVQRVRAYLDFCRWLLADHLGGRVECVAPFVSNGTPNGHWEAGKLIRDPAAYVLIAEFMAGR